VTATRPPGRPWIVVADDDPAIRTLWVTELDRAGYRTVQATNGREALELMRALVPDLVVLDLQMPELTGEDVLAYAQTAPALRQIPVLVVSGHLEEAGRPDLPLRVVGRLAKPVDVARFRRAVEAALSPPAPPSLGGAS